MADPVDNFLKRRRHFDINVPLDLQTHRSRYYDVDHSHKSVLNDLENICQKGKPMSSTDIERMKTMLMKSVDMAEKKLSISEHVLDIVNDNVNKLDESVKNIDTTKVSENQKKKLLEFACRSEDSDSASIEIISISSSDEQDSSERNKSEQQQRSKSNSSEEEEKEDGHVIDPTYCICEEISYGDMVCCDNDLCPLEWFHFGCVGVTRKPKGKWYCPKCRGTSSRRMKSKKLFLEELKEYNRQKEESFK